MNNRVTYRPDRIRKAREMKDITLDQFSSALGVSKATLSRYETGDVKGIRLNTINEIALILDVNPAWILGNSDSIELPSSLKETLTEFGDLETRVVVSPTDDDLGDCLAAVATDEDIREVVRVLLKMSEEKRDLALKMIGALSE